MDSLLLIVTGLSLAMALAMGAVLVRVLRDERRRSDARVAALVEMSAPPADAVAPAIDLDLRDAKSPAVNDGQMFAQREPGPAWGPRLAVAAVMAVLVLSGGYLLTGTRGATSPTAAAEAAPLELLSLHHASQPDRLTVSGVVLNPRGGGPRSGVVATAFAFGADGALLASARAAVDVTAMSPGEESPFVVTIPLTGSVARYRVGFRAGDGAVIAHVDRRSASEALAQK